MTGQDRTIQWMTGQYLNLSIIYERRHLVGAIFSRLRDPSATMVSELPGSVKSGFPGKQRGPGSGQPAAGARHCTRITKQAHVGSVGACSAKNVEIKDCMFMCGCTLGRTKSPLESGQLIEAEYPGGLGTADLFCANTYRAKYRHKYTREELVAEMKANTETMDKFLQHRAAAIARAKRKLEKGHIQELRQRTFFDQCGEIPQSEQPVRRGVAPSGARRPAMGRVQRNGEQYLAKTPRTPQGSHARAHGRGDAAQEGHAMEVAAKVCVPVEQHRAGA